ncbi:MAG: recombination protein RecR [Bacteroidetes bacterium]|nr:recombination protein RecR [Bacteroidota bacterium]MBK9670695.1 recombination protein RecR [Bacteroidota bacterium]MBK9799868.1 recombination protein RecR [Bacteroidota bacterium]MBP6413246.1 recombination protein RecR [Bacteroidia bacterium]
MNFSSKLIDDAVNQFATLPGIGKKTALRMVLHLLKKAPDEVESFGNAMTRMRNEIKYCQTCHNISDAAQCEICSNHSRNHSLLCVVEDIRDVIAIESTNQYNGLYHLLGGIISPMEGIGPKDLNIESLVQRVSAGEVKEIIMALSTTMEGDTTNFYLYKRLKDFGLTISTIARGIAVGDELEYADEVTLGRSILQRTPYENSLMLK